MSAGHRCSPWFLPQFRDGTGEDHQRRVLILRGAEDEVAPLTEVNKLISDLRAAKVGWELQLFSGAQHLSRIHRTPPKSAPTANTSSRSSASSRRSSADHRESLFQQFDVTNPA